LIVSLFSQKVNQYASPIARLIGDARVSVLKMFHPPSDTAGTHAAISIHIAKLLVGFLLSFPLSQEIQVGDSHFLSVHDGDVGCANALILLSYWRGKVVLKYYNDP
jgi:hypothetical protein